VRTSPPPSVAHSELTVQAQAVHAALHGFGRSLLTIDDPTMDLPVRQLKVCLALLRSSCSMSELGREVGLSPSSVTQVSDRLERRGLVERVFEEGDRRVRRLQLTAKGLRLMRRHEEKQLLKISGALDRLTEQELEQLMSGLEILTRSCSRGTNGSS
jgi:MarR family transcriptional regulator, organic hydroperoxide resistance regulator